MGDVVAVAEASPLSLYIELEAGAKASLETVARSALAFAGAVREAAYIIDPSLEIRIELMSGTEGSLSLNSIIRSLKSRDLFTKKRLLAIAFIAASWFVNNTAGWTYNNILDRLLNHEEAKHLSKEEMEEVAQLVANALEKRIASQEVARVYRELETDPAVTGVGATTTPGEKPETIVPRSEFARRANPAVIKEIDTTRRVRTTIERVTLISPVLLETGRRWRFSGKEGEFGAAMKDARFREDVVNGRTIYPMIGGIQMEIELETKEEKIDGAWQVIERNVLRVRNVFPPISQATLDLPAPPPDDESHDSSDEHED